MKRNKKNAFTLAEVLITLTIIGVIAAITIPNLMQTWRRHERISQIKTAYSIIQNIIRMAVADYGDLSGWSWENGGDFAEKYVVPYVKTQKICGMASTLQNKFSKNKNGCFLSYSSTFPNGTWRSLKGDVEQWGGYDSRWFYNMKLQNGMDLGVWATATVNQNGYERAYFVFDVNGSNGPTQAGNDVFGFMLQPHISASRASIVRTFSDGVNGNYGCNMNDGKMKGLNCTRIIEENGWDFPENYPIKKF